MRHSINAAVFAALSVLFSAGLQAAEHQHGEMHMAEDSAAQQVIQGTGTVKEIDLNSKKITIAHEAIPAVSWPAMTMRFTFVQANNAITQLTPGSQVDFSFVQQGNISLLKSITRRQ